MNPIAQIPLLLDVPASPADPSDPFVAALIEAMKRNLERPAGAHSMVVLTGAEGWCAPPEPLACGCSTDVLESGVHEPGCTVLDIPAATEGAP